MNPFTKRKFLSLPTETQHKKCAELLRQLYENAEPELSGYYNEIQEWMERESLFNLTHEDLSNRYHVHLKLANVHLNEHALLPRARQGDRDQTLAPAIEVHTYLDQIRSAHNVGSILRTVEAFHMGTVYFSPDTPTEMHPQVNKTSMGCSSSVECLRQVAVKDLPGPLIALETCTRAIPLNDYIFPYPCCIAIGNEEFGLSQEVLDKADTIVEIPLYGKKNSLNVANAFAIAAAALSQQFRSKECYAPI